MLYTEKTLKTLEFDKIREMLAAVALTEGARKLALSLTPSNDIDEVVLRQRQTTDSKRLMNVKGMPPFGGVKEVTGACDRAENGAERDHENLRVPDAPRIIYTPGRIGKVFAFSSKRFISFSFLGIPIAPFDQI